MRATLAALPLAVWVAVAQVPTDECLTHGDVCKSAGQTCVDEEPSFQGYWYCVCADGVTKRLESPAVCPPTNWTPTPTNWTPTPTNWTPTPTNWTPTPTNWTPTPTNTTYDCTWNSQTAQPWTRTQREWCCAHQQVRCPSAAEKAEQRCAADYASLTEGEKRACCSRFAVGCTADAFDCFTGPAPGAAWPAAQAEWCCAHRNRGCVCRDAPALSVVQPTCCEQQFVACDPKWVEREADKDEEALAKAAEAKRLRLKLQGEAEELYTNLRSVLCRLRRALLLASPALQQQPGRLVVTALGGLRAGAVPDSAAWRRPVLRQWNDVCVAAERAAFDAATARTAVLLQAGGAAEGGDGLFVDFIITGDGEADVAKAEEQLRGEAARAEGGSGTSVWDNTAEGQSLVVDPLAGIEELPSPAAGVPTTEAPAEGGSASWVVPVLGSIGGLAVCAGIAAFVVYKRKQDQEVTLGELFELTRNDGLDLTQYDQAEEA